MPELERISVFGTRAGSEPLRVSCARDVTLTERPWLAMLRVQRLPGTEPASGDSMARWDLPANTASGSDPAVLWTSPVERLIVCGSQPAETLAELLTEREAHATIVTDVSHALVALRLEGRGAIGALAADVGIDLEGREMAAGRCAQTLFAQQRVLLHRPSPDEVFDLYIDRATAVFVRDWLVRCAGGKAPRGDE